MYDKNREFILTSSPSMDILISSNLERLIYHIAGNDSDKNKELMKLLGSEGKYEITEEMKKNLDGFVGGYASEEETAERIHDLYEDTGYVLDTHTAVASHVYCRYADDSKDATPAVIASTASPYKFARAVMTAVDEKYAAMDDFDLIDELKRLSNVEIPNAIEEIRTAPILHDRVCDKDDMKETVMNILGLEA